MSEAIIRCHGIELFQSLGPIPVKPMNRIEVWGHPNLRFAASYLGSLVEVDFSLSIVMFLDRGTINLACQNDHRLLAT